MGASFCSGPPSGLVAEEGSRLRESMIQWAVPIMKHSQAGCLMCLSLWLCLTCSGKEFGEMPALVDPVNSAAFSDPTEIIPEVDFLQDHALEQGSTRPPANRQFQKLEMKRQRLGGAGVGSKKLRKNSLGKDMNTGDRVYSAASIKKHGYTTKQAHMGIFGHYYLGPHRRRVGSGFARMQRRRSVPVAKMKINKLGVPTPIKMKFRINRLGVPIPAKDGHELRQKTRRAKEEKSLMASLKRASSLTSHHNKKVKKKKLTTSA